MKTVFNRRWTVLVLLVALGAMGILAPSAKANIIPAFVSATGPVAGVFTWTYSGSLSAGEKTSCGGGAVCNPGGTTAQWPIFFTLYDIVGLSAGTETQPAGWAA